MPHSTPSQAHRTLPSGDLWNFPTSSSGGMTLELVDGSEHFLCFDCMERLPGDREPTAEDVAAL